MPDLRAPQYLAKRLQSGSPTSKYRTPPSGQVPDFNPPFHLSWTYLEAIPAYIFFGNPFIYSSGAALSGQRAKMLPAIIELAPAAIDFVKSAGSLIPPSLIIGIPKSLDICLNLDTAENCFSVQPAVFLVSHAGVR